ncbi:13.6 kDa protein [Human adenovirus 16]|uniref:13.6 kDa protein n=3 Tax=Human mastadenovirus B TaxID=108098 RepID=Q2KRV0_ADE16|nr:13.6 kDa protein [Human adenovirus 16]AET87250.1 ORF4 [Human adenovirus 68]AGT77317.1 E4 control protein orf4 [Human mastadenovirus B]
MILPSLPSPLLLETQSSCIAWLGFAYATVDDFLRTIKYDGVLITTEASILLTNLRVWLYLNYQTEHTKRQDRRRRKVCCARAAFCYTKYENVRKQLHYDKVARTLDIMRQTSPLHQSPVTTM